MHTHSLSTPTLRVTEQKPDDAWVEGVFFHPLYPEGCWFLAMVFNEPSEYGYKKGRVSKLDIMPVPKRVYGMHYDNQLAYAYDRHNRRRDKTGFPQTVVRALVKELDALPLLYVPNC
jgi:hypothetical protein